MSKIISGKIKKLCIEDKRMIIELESGDTYFSDIIKGSVSCEIFNDLNKIVPLSYLDEGDLIKLKVLENKIKNIYINSKYQFMSDSSSEGGYLSE